MKKMRFRVATESHGEVTIEARGKKGTYHVSFYCQGKHVRRSLKASNKTAAIDNLTLVLREFSQLDVSKIQPVRLVPHGVTSDPAMPLLTLAEGMNYYLESLRTKGSSTKDVQQIETRIASFNTIMAGLGVAYFQQIQGIHADQFFQTIRIGRHTNTSVGYFRFVKAMLSYLKTRQLISNNPFVEISFARVEGARTPQPTLIELNQILAKVEPSYMVPLTALALLGCRAGALARIKTKHVDLDKGTVFIEKPRNQSTKTIERTVPIHPRLLKVLREYKRPRSSFYFCTPPPGRSKSGRKLKPEHLNVAFQEAAKKARFPVGRAENGLVAHSLRGFFKSHTTLICRIPREVVDIWQGHREDNRVGTRHYIDMTIEQSIEFMKHVDFGS